MHVGQNVNIMIKSIPFCYSYLYPLICIHTSRANKDLQRFGYTLTSCQSCVLLREFRSVACWLSCFELHWYYSRDPKWLLWHCGVDWVKKAKKSGGDLKWQNLRYRTPAGDNKLGHLGTWVGYALTCVKQLKLLKLVGLLVKLLKPVKVDSNVVSLAARRGSFIARFWFTLVCGHVTQFEPFKDI